MALIDRHEVLVTKVQTQQLLVISYHSGRELTQHLGHITTSRQKYFYRIVLLLWDRLTTFPTVSLMLTNRITDNFSLRNCKRGGEDDAGSERLPVMIDHQHVVCYIPRPMQKCVTLQSPNITVTIWKERKILCSFWHNTGPCEISLKKSDEIEQDNNKFRHC